MRFLLKFPTLIENHDAISIIRRSFRLSSLDSFIELIETNSRNRSLRRGILLHGHLVTSGLARLPGIARKLVVFYAECGKLADARKMFEEMPTRDICRWIVTIGAYARCGYFQEALDVFGEMHREGIKLDRFMIPSVLRASSNLLDIEFGKVVHCLVLKRSFESDAFVVSSLIDMYSKCEEVENARNVFNSLPGKDLVVLNAMVSGYAQNRFVEEALSLVKEMEVLGIKPDIVTWNALIAGFSQMGDEVRVYEILRLMCLDGHKPDVVSWTSVISGLVQNFQNEKAFDAFRQMLHHGLFPNSATISTLLPACATLANLKRGKEIHGCTIVTGMEDNVYVRSALIDMYAKCGSISQAKILFHEMPKKGIVTFNSMIFGYANHGFSEEAIELFHQMEADGQRLNRLTFTAVLTACSHAGLIDLGQRLFLEMQKKYRIVPRLEHYACMVDLLGRAGKLVEAYDMIKDMPIEPDFFVWGALLGACRNHGNIKLAQTAAKRLAELEPASPANSLLLSHLYADAGSWDSVLRLKKMQKRKRLRRFPGSSWIETM